MALLVVVHNDDLKWAAYVKMITVYSLFKHFLLVLLHLSWGFVLFIRTHGWFVLHVNGLNIFLTGSQFGFVVGE